MSSHRATSSAKSGDESALRPAMGGQSHYQLLELSPQASAAELRQAFRNLSKRYHPDTTTLPPAEAREAFTRLRQAYTVLADPDSRRAYDAALQRPLPPPVTVPPLPTGAAATARPIGVRRSLSGGEWFALVLLGLALALSLVLGVGLAWARGAALITPPSWWSDATAVSGSAVASDNVALERGAPEAPAPERLDSAAVGPERVASGLAGPAPDGRDGAAAAPLSPSVVALQRSASAGAIQALPSGDPTERGGIRQAR